MELSDIIRNRRAFRSLAPVIIDSELIRDLADHVRLAPSCYNYQPWRYVFAYDPEILSELFKAMKKGNEWTSQASMIIAVFSEESLDCVIKDRKYYLFDTGMGTAFLILRATELGLVAHPIAGYDPDKVKEILHIPPEMMLITLVIVGKKADYISPLLDEKKAQIEKERPERLQIDQFVFVNSYGPEGLR
ncbi:MAG: nitroreductase family protein [Candidatus Omnitrophota bacterium]